MVFAAYVTFCLGGSARTTTAGPQIRAQLAQAASRKPYMRNAFVASAEAGEVTESVMEDTAVGVCGEVYWRSSYLGRRHSINRPGVQSSLPFLVYVSYRYLTR